MTPPTGATLDHAGQRRRSAVIWDVDGVILDSAEQHRQAWAALAREQGFPYTDDAFWAGFGRRNRDVIPLMFGVDGPPERITALGERKEQLYRALLVREATPLPGAKELMAALHAAGYRQALGSSAPEENLATIVRLLGLAAWLEATVSGESVPRGKPAPDLFLAAAARLGVAPQRSLVIEDAPAGVQAAHAAGMRCLAVRRAGQADAPGIERADYVVDTLRGADVALVDRLLGIA
jgi:beta-phosphoglucomutase